MAAKGFEESWRAAEAAKPSTWRIMRVVSGPRVADPAIEGEEVRRGSYPWAVHLERAKGKA